MHFKINRTFGLVKFRIKGVRISEDQLYPAWPKVAEAFKPILVLPDCLCNCKAQVGHCGEVGGIF